MKKNYNDFILRLLRDKKLRRFAFHLINCKDVLKMIDGKEIKANLVLNSKGRYRLHLHKGGKFFDFHPDCGDTSKCLEWLGS